MRPIIASPSKEDPILLGVSQCLLGQPVRYDGGHAQDPFVSGLPHDCVAFIPVCPEVELGMGTPRPTIHLVDEGQGAGVRLLCPSTGEDHTDAMKTYAKERIEALKAEQLDGYIFKRRSPSCAIEGLPIYRGDAPLELTGRGLFADALMTACPSLPVEDEGGLSEASRRWHFITRIFCRFRWRHMAHSGLTRGKLVAFHTRHKLLLLSHHEAGYRRLGAIVGGMNRDNEQQVFSDYKEAFHDCLSRAPSVKSHVNVLMHAMGHLKRDLSPEDKKALVTAIDDYRQGLCERDVPMTLLQRDIERFDVSYLAEQRYFSPDPKALTLRSV